MTDIELKGYWVDPRAVLREDGMTHFVESSHNVRALCGALLMLWPRNVWWAGFGSDAIVRCRECYDLKTRKESNPWLDGLLGG